MSESSPSREKPKLTAAQQIESMKKNGIRFDLFPESRAEAFLTHRNYFFKLKAFSKNFDKWRLPDGSAGDYMHLDFAYLVELSRLDMRLRALVLSASLDIEHFLKVRINEAIMSDETCDGYDIVADFLQYDESRKKAALGSRVDMQHAKNTAMLIRKVAMEAAKGLDHRESSSGLPVSAIEAFDGIREMVDELTGGVDLHHIDKSISFLGTSSYSRKVAKKYGEAGRMAVWNLMELASFGDIISLYKFCFVERSERRDVTAQAVKPLLFPAKTLRNAAAHNSCLLHGLRDRLSAPVGAIAKTLRDEYGYDAEEVAGTKRVPVVHDLSAMLICYDRIVEAQGIRCEKAGEMRLLRTRLTRHIDYFSKQPEVVASITFAAKLLEGFADSLEGRMRS